MKKDSIITTDLTWRQILWRVALLVGTVALIVWFMPRDTQLTFKIERDRPWPYADLTASFDFPVLKSESRINAERDSALRDFEPYYTLRSNVEREQVRLFMQTFAKGLPGLQDDYKSIIANRLSALYQQGIADNMEVLGEQVDSTRYIKIVVGQVAQSRLAVSVLTAPQAYEALTHDEALAEYREELQQLDLNNFIVPNLIYDNDRSEIQRQDLLNSVAQSSGYVLRGQKVISRGSIVDEKAELVLESYVKEFNRRHATSSNLSTTILGELLYVFLMVLSFTGYLWLFRKDYFEHLPSLAFSFSLILLFSVLGSLLVDHSLLHVFILPLAMAPIFVRVFMDSRTAFMLHIVIVLILASILMKPFDFIAVETMAGMAAIYSMRELSSRSQLFWTAAVTTLVAMLTNFAISLIRTDDLSSLDLGDFNYLILAGVTLFCSYPILYIMERLFGFTSDITLIELSDMNKPLLRRMSEVAPGTFQHSIQVGNLAAEIARKIGANPLLVRTGALYHDIGKTQNPIYFTENQSGGINPHDQLSYIDSAQMIISHVTEGLKLAEKNNLPPVLKGFISTHPGQGKAKYFYVKWKNEHPDEEVDDLLFTYPGPNPFTKEQAVLMMADAVEAASRSMPDYTEQSIRLLVNRILDQQVQDGYFRDCPITFRDIQYAKTVLIEKLKTIYHTRISYPELKKEEAPKAP
ncbi:MAG: HDIG domain-containing protein [Prevotella sp.]|nr:HDIG domain-containing protein [Prevotella sp.]